MIKNIINNMATLAQKGKLSHQLRLIRQGKEGTEEQKQEVLQMFPDRFSGDGTGGSYFRMNHYGNDTLSAISKLSVDECSIVIGLLDKGMIDEALNQFKLLINK